MTVSVHGPLLGMPFFVYKCALRNANWLNLLEMIEDGRTGDLSGQSSMLVILLPA
ncbi:MAG: hypothetical protein K8R11_04715 [Methanococcoides sp.]|nr:hypothetical protein [Methanococcoides sp.]